jgi:hypothetical protein
MTKRRVTVNAADIEAALRRIEPLVAEADHAMREAEERVAMIRRSVPELAVAEAEYAIAIESNNAVGQDWSRLVAILREVDPEAADVAVAALVVRSE